MISVIIPVSNQIELVKCCLYCLVRGNVLPDEVIIIDDNSDSRVSSIAEGYLGETGIPFQYIYQWWKGGVTPGRARNVGVQRAKGDTIIFLDSHVITAVDWLETFIRIRDEHPGVIICGRYDWLPNMNISVEKVMLRFERVITCRFHHYEIKAGPVIGVDPRWWNGKIQEKMKPGDKFGLGMFGGNTLMPRKLFIDSGGFDEFFVAHGGEDAELGLTLEEMGAKAMFTEGPMGWHLYHDRKNEKTFLRGLKRNIKYILKKHDPKRHGIKASPNWDYLYYEDGTFVPEPMAELIKEIRQ